MISYREILKISTPIMVGSAVQNLIALTDLFFLGRVGETELGAIGLVGVFYLTIAAIGYGFSKGGQIMIARRFGEGQQQNIGVTFYSMLAFEMMLAILLFFAMFFGAGYFFFIFIPNSPDIYQACLDYLYYRQFGIFFSYAGVAAMALYTGVARTKVIIYNAIVLGIINIILNYGLIFGKFGLPEMGMAGAGFASSIAEGLAFFVFIIYFIMDRKELANYGFWGKPAKTELASQKKALKPIRQLLGVDLKIISTQLKISMPIVMQSVVGLGSWFIFFSLIANIGERELAISNLIRAVYLVYMIPCWGFSSGINTIASNLIGQRKLKEVIPTINKTAFLSFIITGVFALLLLIAPNFVLRIGTDDLTLISESLSLIWILVLILFLYSISAIYFNGLAGTGATGVGLNLQIFSAVVYLGYLYIFIHKMGGGLTMAWMSEITYWVCIFTLSFWYLKTYRWKAIKV